MTSRLLLIGTLCIPTASSLLAPLSAQAARPAAGSASATDEDTYIERGLDLRKKENDEAALVEFQHAYEVSKSGRALAQVALAEQALGHWVDAETHLIEALSHDRESWIARNRGPLTQSLNDIKEHLGSLEISGGVPRAEIRINGQRVGELPLAAPLRVIAGSVAMEVRASGYLPVLRTVTVSAKGLSREPVAMVPVTSAQPENTGGESVVARPQPPEGPPKESGGHQDTGGGGGGGWTWQRTTGVVLVSAGVIALGAGTGFLLQRESRASDFNKTCSTDGNVVYGPPGCLAKYNDVQSSLKMSIGGYVAGGVLVLAGVTFFIFGGNEGGSTHAARPSRDASRWACAPSLGLGAGCVVTF